MKPIWYLLKCPEGKECEYTERFSEFVNPDGLSEAVCFQYQRLIRYGGQWHMENRTLLPGYVFLFGTDAALKEGGKEQVKTWRNRLLIPCETPYLRELCQEGNMIGMSRGIIRNGNLIITGGPLKGREELVRKINRHKRTAEIEIPFAEDKKRVTVGLEVYKKQA